MSVEYQIIHTKTTNFELMIGDIEAVFRSHNIPITLVEKKDAFWMVESKIGGLIVQVEDAEWYADIYHIKAVQNKIMILSIEVHRGSPHRDLIESVFMNLIYKCFEKEDFVFCYEEEACFQRLHNTLTMSAWWANKWADSCDWRFEVSKIEI